MPFNIPFQLAMQYQRVKIAAMKRPVSKKIKKIQEALKPLAIPGKPADAPVKPAHLAKLLDVAPSSLSRWMKDEVVPRGRQKERLDILYRTILEAEAGNTEAKAMLEKLVSPTPAMGMMSGGGLTAASFAVSPIRFGLLGAIASAGLGWLLSDKEDNDEE